MTWLITPVKKPAELCEFSISHGYVIEEGKGSCYLFTALPTN